MRLLYGAAVELVMRLIVLPLSAVHAKGPYELHDEDSRAACAHGRGGFRTVFDGSQNRRVASFIGLT